MTKITIDVEFEKLRRIDKLAKLVGQSRSWSFEKAISSVTEYENWFVAEVRKGLR
jgi:predicted transcriptional regulator